MSQVSIIDIEGNNPQIPTQFDANDGFAIPIANVLEILGDIVLAGVNPVRTVASGNTLTTQVQISQAIAASDATKIGLSVFDSQFFTVNSAGFVSISGSSLAKTITGNSGGARSPSAGNWNIITANSTAKFVGTGSTLTLDFGLSNLILGTSGSSITSAQSNVGLGTSVFNALSSGVRNTALGAGALMTLVGDYDTTAIGYNCLNVASGSNGNTGVGSYCLVGCTTGGGHTAVGQASLGAIAANINCTGIGFQSLTHCTGSSNTALGWSTATGLLTGTFNLFLGTSAGQNYVGAESSNILIASGGTAAESNVLRIGNQGSSIGQVNKAFIAGITGVTVAGKLANIASTGQVGEITGGTSGTLLQSTGASTSPGWTTATYPATATGTGTLLRADGTNWSATTSTYPNTNAANTILYASGANVMSALATANNGVLVTSNAGVPSILAGGTTGQILQANSAAAPSFSTATYPSTAGTSGNVLTSNGTNVSSAAPSSITLYMSCPTNSSPADSITYFFTNGASPLTTTTTVTTPTRLYFPIATTIRAVAGNFHNSAGTPGSNENCTVFIRVNGSTDTNVTTTLQLTATDNPVTVSGLAISISAGDYISIGFTGPAWATNPTNINATISISAW